MYLSNVLAGTFLATISTVAAQGTEAPQEPWVWSATGFGGGCSPAACGWAFNITAPAYQGVPGFKAFCSGNTLQNQDNWVTCEQSDANKAVASKMGAFHELPDHLNAYMFVTYKYTTSILPNVSVSYNFTGMGEAWWAPRTNPPTSHNFTISPTDFEVQRG